MVLDGVQGLVGQAAAVKEALSSGKATTSTVVSLQCLLNSEAAPPPPRPKQGKAAGASKAGKTKTNASARNGSRTQPIQILEDSKYLTAKDKYGLATDVVNITLKVLTRAPKSERKLTTDGDSKRCDPSTPRRSHDGSSTICQSALQSRSGNATPVKQLANGAKRSLKSPNPLHASPRADISSQIVPVAECARLGFAYLRSVDPEKLGLRSMPQLQLESGMLALSGRLVALGLDSLAIKELRVLKRRLEKAVCAGRETKRNVSAMGSTSPAQPDKDTLATLLQVDVHLETRDLSHMIPLVVTYQTLILKLISSSRKPAVIEACVPYLDSESHGSPASLITEQARQSKDSAKHIKQLQGLSETILRLCPSVSPSADKVAVDRSISPCVATAFQLQTTALRIRKEWWTLAGHRADLAKDMIEPYGKCLTAFVRRSSASSSRPEVYSLAKASYESLALSKESKASTVLVNIHRTMASLADRSGCLDETQQWIDGMLKSCTDLEPGHALTATALAKQVNASKGRVNDEEPDGLIALEEVLRGQLYGNSADYDSLLAELAELAKHLCDSDAHHSLSCLAASFGQRYIRSYPGKSTKQAQTIILNAVRHSRTSEDLLAWITEDAAKAFIQTGVLQQVAELSATKPMPRCWSASSATFALGRVLHALALRTVRAQTEGRIAHFFEGGEPDTLERAIALEWQLWYAIDLAHRPKYHAALQKILPNEIHKLAGLYAENRHPLRRASVAILLLRFQEFYPELLSSDLIEEWLGNFDIESDLAEDESLNSYAVDLRASLRLSYMFHQGRPSAEELNEPLLVWQQIMDPPQDSQSVTNKIFDPKSLLLQLRSTASYLGALGEDAARLPLLRLISRLIQLSEGGVAEQCTALIDLGTQYLELGYSERAGYALGQARTLVDLKDANPLVKLRLQVAYSEYLVTIDNTEKARDALAEAKRVRDALAPEQIKKDQKQAYELLHARAWLVQSKYCLETGAPQVSLAAAKRSVRILNSMWSAIERATGSNDSTLNDDSADSTTEPEVNSLVTGVSKLQLLPKGSPRQEARQTRTAKGARFWALVPLLCMALMHLSDVYAHHGMFHEADYHSTRAVQIAESVGAKCWLLKVSAHRCQLLALANRLEEAELCLANCQRPEPATISLVQVNLSRAQAALSWKEGSVEDALEHYEHAERLIQQLQTLSYVAGLEQYQLADDILAPRIAALTITAKDKDPIISSARSTSNRRPTAKNKANPTTVKATSRQKTSGAAKTVPKIVEADRDMYLLRKVKAQVLCEKTLVSLQVGQDSLQVLSTIKDLPASVAGTLRHRRLQFRSFMQRANAALQSDFTFNILPESTLAFPALIGAETRPLDHATALESSSMSSDRKSNTADAVSCKSGRRKKIEDETLAGLLISAKDSLIKGHVASLQYGSTADMHMECAMLSSVTMLLSAAALSQSKGFIHPIREAMYIDRPRINAMEFERRAVLCDATKDGHDTPLSWPAAGDPAAPVSFTGAEYQEQYIDILPKPWTAVSLCMNDDCSELYVARYCAAQSPLILRLPFSRHKPDEDEDEDRFDFHTGKTELQDIIQASNFSCHNTGNVEAKGAKSNWWIEREALDKRLHELLINIENIWLGGFKAVFSQSERRPELLARFRKSFDNILARYLPSRNAAKGHAKHSALDSKVLELFIGLGNDEDGVKDLDDPLTDLLYFVVDMLQFDGERNAYDEIDFDSMVVDVLDALRSYHEACPDDDRADRHLILVLDKRLQAFPWESLPCLEASSVSRVGSMLCLRERILSMRQRSRRSTYLPPDCHAIDRKSGAYILNPSVDLAQTQTTLSPALSKLFDAQDAQWTAIVRREPSEAEFSSALTESSMVLYFGHGAGSQYIRPRTIKRLAKCSDVVWLMGCSSGAVTEYGELEPYAVPLAYLLAGSEGLKASADSEEASSDANEGLDHNSMCMAVVATLWDVTDRDIDRFSLAVGEEWGLWPGSEASRLPAKAAKKRERVAVPSTAQHPPKTPKTPKVSKTPAATKTPARSRSRLGRHNDGKKQSLVEAVANSREACYLRYLNGAAPVVYGVPVYLGD